MTVFLDSVSVDYKQDSNFCSSSLESQETIILIKYLYKTGQTACGLNVVYGDEVKLTWCHKKMYLPAKVNTDG